MNLHTCLSWRGTDQKAEKSQEKVLESTLCSKIPRVKEDGSKHRKKNAAGKKEGIRDIRRLSAEALEGPKERFGS